MANTHTGLSARACLTTDGRPAEGSLAAFQVQAADVTAALPADLQERPLLPFFSICRFPEHEAAGSRFSFFLAGFRTARIRDLPAAILSFLLQEPLERLEEDMQLLHLFLRWLTFCDLQALCSRVFHSLEDPGLLRAGVLQQRAAGMSQAEIARCRQVSRQNVSMMEQRALDSFVREIRRPCPWRLLSLLFAYCGGSPVLQRADLEGQIGPQRAALLWFCLSRRKADGTGFLLDSSYVCYDGEADALVVGTDAAGRPAPTAPMVRSAAAAVIRKLPDILEDLPAQLQARAAELQLPYRLLELQAAKAFTVTGSTAHRGHLTPGAMYDYALKTCFPDGYRVRDAQAAERMTACLRGLFGPRLTPSPGAVDAHFRRTAVLCGPGLYMHPDLIPVSPAAAAQILEWISRDPRTELSWADLYCALDEAGLLAGTPITDRWRLQGILKHCGVPWKLTRDCLRKES